MKNVLIIGANGNIASKVVEILAKEEEIKQTLFVRNKSRVRNPKIANATIIEGDAMNYEQLKSAVSGQDIVYANLSGALEAMVTNIVKAMNETGVKRLVFISSIGIYGVPLKPVLKPYRKAADVIESSNLEYTILRPTWFTSTNEVDFELTQKGEPEKGSVISQKSLATFVAQIIANPEQYCRKNLGINKPNS